MGEARHDPPPDLLAPLPRHLLVPRRVDGVSAVLEVVDMIYEGVNLKPSAVAILIWMRRRSWIRTEDVWKGCACVTPSKRLDELHDAGMIEKRKRGKGNEKEYRAKEVSP